MSLNKGAFIVVDGMDGTGKTTQITLLQASLEALGYKVLRTREPGGSPGAEEIRKLLLEGPADRWDKVSELFLFSAGRRDHVEKVVKPAIEEGKIVICDRFVSSTLAYQGYGHRFSLMEIEQVTQIALDDFRPDLSVFLTIGLEEGLQRAFSRRGGGELRFENLDLDFHRRVQEGYRQIIKNRTMTGPVITEIDTSSIEGETPAEGIDRIADRIFGAVNTYLGSRDKIELYLSDAEAGIKAIMAAS
jgi:dTMP kinase